MNAFQLLNGNLLIPVVAESEGIIGDGMKEVGPETKEYKDWMAYYKRLGKEPPPLPAKDKPNA